MRESLKPIEPARDGGPAFPALDLDEAGRIVEHAMGMSLRDWFAGQALVGLLRGPVPAGTAAVAIAEAAYCNADAMLAARNAPESAQEPADGEGKR